ncbi:MAG: cysteine desulfurase family protein [Candidatus Nitrosocosmicus sp.]
MTSFQDRNKNKFIYLDNAASTPIDKQVLEEMLHFLTEDYGNPSSLHKLGRNSRQAILNARLRISKSIGAKLNELYFTSGGTESNNLALFGLAKLIKRTNPICNQILVSEIEHDSVLETLKNISKEMQFKIIYIPTKGDGIIDIESFKDLVSLKTGIVSIMLVNNEIGTIQPIKKLVEIAKYKNNKIIFHTDAVQALGKIPLDVNSLGIDVLTISAHKINGPKGAGAIYIKQGIYLEPLLFGGGQEAKLRSGTENVQSIVGFGKACEKSKEKLEDNQLNKIKEMQNYAINRILKEIPYSMLNGSRKERIPQNINFSFLGVNGEDLLIKLDENGIACSTGSACSSNKKQKASHVLKAIGLTYQEITGSIRFSIGYQNTIEEIENTVTKLKYIVEDLRKVSEFNPNIKRTIKRNFKNEHK